MHRGPFLISLGLHILLGLAMIWASGVSETDSKQLPQATVVKLIRPASINVPPPSKPAVMDQKNRQFLPRVLAIQTGTSVKFPNSDNVRHQVYSFSSPKKFQLPLYEGTPAEPIVFDKAGVVVLGCNIHDRMSAVIVVVDTPHFAMAEKGRAQIGELPVGKYDVSVWYPGAKDGTKPQSVTLAAGEARELVITAGSE